MQTNPLSSVGTQRAFKVAGPKGCCGVLHPFTVILQSNEGSKPVRGSSVQNRRDHFNIKKPEKRSPTRSVSRRHSFEQHFASLGSKNLHWHKFNHASVVTAELKNDKSYFECCKK